MTCAGLAIQKLFFNAPLANRPLLLLGVLLLVLGVQVVSIGLVGEIIIFLSSRREAPVVTEISAAHKGGETSIDEGPAVRPSHIERRGRGRYTEPL
jgi:hypothetical protein